MSAEYLTPAQLVARWGGAVSIGTLANWRSHDRGPPYTKAGRKVMYSVKEIEEYEKQFKTNTSEVK